MKKIFLLLVFALTAAFAEPEGVFVDVELMSGTHQRAKFLGIENDTVSLGGYIQNKFTVVKIAKKQFKKIVDEKGNDLLNETSKPQATDTVASSSSTKVDTKQAAISSSSSEAQAPIESQTQDSLEAAPKTEEIEKPEKPQVIRKSDISNCDDNICIQNELTAHGFRSIYFGEIVQNIKTDSLTLNLTHAFYEDSLPILHRSSVNVSRASAFGDAITNNKLKNQLLDAQGKETIKTKKNRTYIHIETDPDGATISRSEKDAICKSPCTFVTSDTTKFTVHAYWNVDRHLWGASTNITPLPGDTVHVSLKLKRVTPEIRILTFPEGASVYKAGAPITKRSKAIAKTPEKIPVYNMGTDSLLIRKAGYRDTLINFYVAPVSQIDLSVDLEKLTDFDEIEKQNKWLHDKKMQTIGEAMIGGAAGTILIGSLLMYFAHLDYSDAEDIKSDLKIPGSAKGKNYQDKVKKNKKLVDQGDNKAIAGSILLGTGAALLGVGLYFYF